MTDIINIIMTYTELCMLCYGGAVIVRLIMHHVITAIVYYQMSATIMQVQDCIHLLGP